MKKFSVFFKGKTVAEFYEDKVVFYNIPIRYLHKSPRRYKFSDDGDGVILHYLEYFDGEHFDEFICKNDDYSLVFITEDEFVPTTLADFYPGERYCAWEYEAAHNYCKEAQWSLIDALNEYFQSGSQDEFGYFIDE